MKHKRAIEVYNENWGIHIAVIWDVSNEAFVKCVKQKYYADMPDNLHTGRALYTSLTSEDGELMGLIAMETGPFTGTPYQYSTLAHECLHAAFHILDSRGLRYKKSSEEAYTYFVDWMVNAIAEAMLKVESRLSAAC